MDEILSNGCAVAMAGKRHQMAHMPSLLRIAGSLRSRFNTGKFLPCAKSLSENSEGCCFCGTGWMARRDEGEYPSWIFDRGATKPAGLFRENPPGGGSFVRGRRWLSPYSPLRGCADFAALATAKIPRRSTLPNFQKGSNFARMTIITDERCT